MTILRLNRELPAAFLKCVGKEFQDIIENGSIECCGIIPEEKQKGEYLDLPRLIMKFNKHDYGRLNQLILRLNSFE
jgi:hypothetical protein